MFWPSVQSLMSCVCQLFYRRWLLIKSKSKTLHLPNNSMFFHVAKAVLVSKLQLIYSNSFRTACNTHWFVLWSIHEILNNLLISSHLHHNSHFSFFLCKIQHSHIIRQTILGFKLLRLSTVSLRAFPYWSQRLHIKYLTKCIKYKTNKSNGRIYQNDYKVKLQAIRVDSIYFALSITALPVSNLFRRIQRKMLIPTSLQNPEFLRWENTACLDCVSASSAAVNERCANLRPEVGVEGRCMVGDRDLQRLLLLCEARYLCAQNDITNEPPAIWLHHWTPYRVPRHRTSGKYTIVLT